MSKYVSLNYLDDYNILNLQKSIEQSFEDFDFFAKFKPKSKILIKVCLPTSSSPDKAETTHPSVVRAVVNLLSKNGISCLVADSPYKKYSSSKLDNVYLNTGMLEMANLTKCELNHDLSTTKIETPTAVMTRSLCVLDIVNHVDAIINIGKLKFDEKLGYMGACSNLFGLIPGEMKNLILNRLTTFKDFNNYIIDMHEALKDKMALNILDGIVALEANNTPRMLSYLGVSDNAYALDATVFDILGIKYDNTILKQAKMRELFDYNKPYKLLNASVEKFKVEDFAFINYDENKRICESAMEQKRYFKRNQQRVVIKPNKCKGCSICSKICPTGAIMMKYDKNGELYAEIDFKKCIFCYKCHTACPYKVVDFKVPLGYKLLTKEIKKYDEK